MWSILGEWNQCPIGLSEWKGGAHTWPNAKSKQPTEKGEIHHTSAVRCMRAKQKQHFCAESVLRMHRFKTEFHTQPRIAACYCHFPRFSLRWTRHSAAEIRWTSILADSYGNYVTTTITFGQEKLVFFACCACSVYLPANHIAHIESLATFCPGQMVYNTQFSK